MMKTPKIQTENLRVQNPNSLDKIQHYGITDIQTWAIVSQAKPFTRSLS